MIRLSFANYGHTETHYDTIERVRNEFKKRKGLKVDKDLKLDINYVSTMLKYFEPAEPLICKKILYQIIKYKNIDTYQLFLMLFNPQIKNIYHPLLKNNIFI